MYLLVILLCAITLAGSLEALVARYYDFRKNLEEFRIINHVEMLVIERVKYRFANYMEKSETVEIDGCQVIITITDLQADITIRYQDMVRYRHLQYDDLDNEIADYY